jgi:hypothetical protein
MQELHCQFEVVDWKEKRVWKTSDGCALSAVEAQYLYRGDVSGESRVNMELIVFANRESHFIAFERIEAGIDGKQGSLILRHTGIHNEQVATGDCEIVNATGDLMGMQEKGSYQAKSQKVEFVLTVCNE